MMLDVVASLFCGYILYKIERIEKMQMALHRRFDEYSDILSRIEKEGDS